MKKTLIVAVLALAALGPFAAFAEELEPFFVFSPRVMAQGGSFTAIASGHEALFTNPAGFYSDHGSLTLASLTAWAFMNPKSVADTLNAPSKDSGSNQMFEVMRGQAKNGFGGGLSAGISWVGGGLGLGFIATSNLMLSGQTFPLGLEGTASTTLAVVGGFATSFNIGSSRFIVGGDLRPMIRAYSTINANTVDGLMSAFFDTSTGNSRNPTPADIFLALNRTSAYQGAGLGIDLGAKWELGSLTLGLSLRDVFNTRMTMYRHGLGDYVEYIKNNGGLPSNSDAAAADGEFYIPMTVNAGLAFHPDFGGLSFLIDPTLHVDLVDPFGVLNEKQTPWALLHAGAEVKVLRFIKIRGGINQGYLTAGAGMKILFLDLNASIFTRELGPYAGDKPNTGMSVEVALRF